MENTRNLLTRRKFLPLIIAAGAVGQAALAQSNGSNGKPGTTSLRGTSGPESFGLVADAGSTDTRRFTELMRRAVAQNQPLFLSPGTYDLSKLELPDRLQLTGIPGSSRIRFSGEGHFVHASNLNTLRLSNLVFDGGNRAISSGAKALIECRNVSDLTIENCEILGSATSGIYLENCRAKVRENRIGFVTDYAIYAVDSSQSSLTDNEVSDCGNGGILVHRWNKGKDGSVVRGNRISRVRADNGGTGPFGNAINIYQADNVIVSDNHIVDSAFTAVRANTASNIQIINNQCLNSGETAIYSEFSFEGALIANNLVDGAANGISAVNFDQGGRLSVINGNLVRNIRDKGPYVHDNVGFGFGIVAEADAVISANVIEDIARFGILAGWGPYLRNVVVNGNMLRRSQTGIAVSVVEEAGKAIITNNLFETVPKGAIVGYRWHDAVTQDLVDAPKLPANLTLSGNSKI